MSSSNDPVYLRVLEDLRDQIRAGVLAPGARVPSRNGIMARYAVGETAAKHALQVLAAEGLIEARAGSGSYVRKLPATSHLEHDRLHFPGSPFGLTPPPIAGNAEAAGGAQAGSDHAGTGAARAGGANGAPSARLSWEHQSERVPAPLQVARRLGLSPGELVTRTRYLLSADGSPVQMATSYEPAALTADTPVPFPEEGPLAGRGVIERMTAIGVSVDEVVEDVWVRPSTAAEAAVLGIPAGAPVLLVERAHWAAGRIVETGEIAIAADRFRLRYRFPVATAAQPAAAGSQPPAVPGSPVAGFTASTALTTPELPAPAGAGLP
jgi:DNA-binding GntR family transcriptional regulator